MNYLKKIGVPLMYSFSFLIGLIIIFTTLNYFNVVNDKIFTYIKIIIPIISIFIGGFKLGKKSNSKGWLEGIKIGLIFVFLMIILSLIFFKFDFNFKSIFYYLILLITSILSSMVGINLKAKNTI